jgi:hypothetical protein
MPDIEMDEGDAMVFLGSAVMLGVGELMIVGGIVLKAIGAKRVRIYERLLRQKNKGLSLGFTSKGVTLRYHF